MPSHTSGILLRSPSEVSASSEGHRPKSEVKFSRSHLESIKNLSESFHLPSRDFQRQYFNIYSQRLKIMRPRVEAAARAKLGEDLTIYPLCELTKAKKGKDVMIIETQKVSVISFSFILAVFLSHGIAYSTLYKHQSLKPNILQELSEENGILPQPSHVKFVSDEDEVILEDDLQRIKLRGAVEVSKFVSGIVCGAYGQEKESGKFEVKEFFFAGPSFPLERPIMKNDKYVALISGLDLADKSSKTLLPFQLVVDYLTGEAGEMEEQGQIANIARVIIAGNSLSESTRDKAELNKARYLTKNIQAGSVDGINLLDKFLVQLAGSVSTDVMPGEFDPSNHVWPQQPLHPCLFPLAFNYPTIKTVTNPYVFSADGIIIGGSSGQNTSDIMRNTNFESPIDALEALVRWAHYAPTAPDTLGCYPFNKCDPFIIGETPHIVFTANHDKFEQRTLNLDGRKVKLLSIPRFSKSLSFVKLNMKSFEAEEIFVNPEY